MFAYVGSRTTRERNARGDGISVYRVDPRDGGLSLVDVVTDLVNPSYLALSDDGAFLYTVHGDQSDVSAFRVDRATGRLTFLNRQGTEGRNPVHLVLDPAQRRLIVTNHLGANVAMLPVATDGALGPVTQRIPFSGPVGPHRIEQQQAKPHFSCFDPSGRFLLVPDKGLDRVFSFQREGDTLVPTPSPHIQAREGAGPRGLVFHPAGSHVYVVNELDSTVTTCAFDRDTGAVTPLQILSTLPSSFTGNSRAAGIAVDAAGRTLYASNRGHDSIAVFRVDARTGLLAFVSAEPSGGRTPRFFTLSPDGRMLYALNEDSDTIVPFVVDQGHGGLARSESGMRCGSPVCMVFSGSPLESG